MTAETAKTKRRSANAPTTVADIAAHADAIAAASTNAGYPAV